MKHTKFFLLLFLCVINSAYATDNDLTIAQRFARSEHRQAQLSAEEPQLTEFFIKHCPQQVKDIVFCLQHPELFQEADFPTRLLFVGPPGVGKTTLATVIAHSTNRPYRIIKCSTIGDKFQNSGPSHIKEQIGSLIEEHEPYVIIVDEINLLAEKFNDEAFPDKKTASAFWQYLDEVQKTKHVLFIGTANEITNLPDPLKDRFEGNIVEICMPDAQLKKEIVQFYLQDTECSQTMITALMQKIKHFSGRKIKQLIDRVKRKAVIRTNDLHPELYMCDIQAALADFNYTQSWRMWLHGNWKQIEKHGPSIITWTLTAIGLYISYCHYDKLVPVHMR